MTQGEDGKLLNPLEFAKDILRVELWSKQEEVLSALLENRGVAVKSGNGLGKGYCAAVAVLWFLYCHDPAIVLSTAPTFRQVRHVLWRQIRRLYRRAPDVLGGKILDTRWELAEDRYAIGLSADTADQFQGFHSPNMLIVVDEAEGVSDEIYEAVEAVMTSASPRLLLIGNPTTVTGAFRRAFYQERRLYYTVTISALDSPNVTSNKVVVPGLTTAEWVEERRETWGENNPIFLARVLGEFPDQSEDTLIKLSDIEAAVEDQARSTDEDRLDESEETVLAVNVARFVLAVLEGPGVKLALKNAQGKDKQVVARPAAIGPLGIDSVGVDAEVQVTIIGLRGRDARVVLDAEIETGAAGRIVFADQIAQHAVQVLFRVDTQGDEKLAVTQPQRLAVGNFDIARLPVKSGRAAHLAFMDSTVKIGRRDRG